MSETYLLQFQFVALWVHCACIHPSGFVRARTSTFMHEFQNDLAQLFSLRSRSAV